MENSDEFIEQDFIQRNLYKLLECLKENERKVVLLRYNIMQDGLSNTGYSMYGGIYLRTLEHVGQKLGITKERVRQIEAKAIRRMQTYYRWHKKEFV